MLGHVAGVGEDRRLRGEVGVRRDRVVSAEQAAVERGPARVDVQPGREPRLRTGAARVRRGQQRAGQVEQPPLLEPGGARPPVQAELGRRRTPHHRAAGRADGVEVALHRQVARRGQLEGDLGATPGIHRRGVEADPGPFAVRPQRGHRHPQLTCRGRAGSAGKAELDLAAGLEREVGGVLGSAGGLPDPLDRAPPRRCRSRRRRARARCRPGWCGDRRSENSRATCRRICWGSMAAPDNVRIPVEYWKESLQMSRAPLPRPDRVPLISLVHKANIAMQRDMVKVAQRTAATRRSSTPTTRSSRRCWRRQPGDRHGRPGGDHPAVDGGDHPRARGSRDPRDEARPRRPSRQAGHLHGVRPRVCAHCGYQHIVDLEREFAEEFGEQDYEIVRKVLERVPSLLTKDDLPSG